VKVTELLRSVFVAVFGKTIEITKSHLKKKQKVTQLETAFFVNNYKLV